MKTGGFYSLKQERLFAERQQAMIRVLLSLTTSLLLIKLYFDQTALNYEETHISLRSVVTIVSLFMGYSLIAWALLWWKPTLLKGVMLFCSLFEVLLIAFLLRSPAAGIIPFYLWYIFYVASVATRYGWRHSILALSASFVSYMMVSLMRGHAYVAQHPAELGFMSFLLVLAFLFGQISEKQLAYQASLSVVNEFRGELAGFTGSAEIIKHLLTRVKETLNVEQAWFLPAMRGADGSEAPGLRSAGADPVLLSTFREGGKAWNVEKLLKERKPCRTNNPERDSSLPDGTAARLGLKNLAAAPMLVGSLYVGVVYAANKKDKGLSNSDLQILELMAMQVAPVVENAILWERLRESAASEERVRIARDLHDNFLQTLAAIKLHLERCKILVQKDTGRALSGIDKIHEIATRGLGEVRAYLSELRMMGPEPSRFKQAIEKCTSEIAVKAGFQAHIDIHLPDEVLPPNVALSAFQIMRELLNNAAAHSQAQHVQVRVYTQDGQLMLEIEDDGKGFDVAKVRPEKVSQGHVGLLGVEERTKQSNGSLTITSEPGKGTRATAVLGI